MKVADVGWQPDPTGRYEYRYWDGADWCDDVFDDGLMFRDPMSIGVLPPPTQRSRRWAPRLALLGAGALLAGGAAVAPLMLLPDGGGDDRTETAGQTRLNGSGTTAATSSTTTTAPAGPAGAAGGPGGSSTTAAPPPDSSTTTTTAPAPPPGGDAPADPDTAAIVDTLTQTFKQAGGGMLTDEQARCLGESMVEALGVDRIRELGLDTGDMATMGTALGQLSTEEAATLSQLQSSCAMPGSAG